MQPILQMVLKISKLLQANNLKLLFAVDVLNSLKSSVISMINNPNHFENINQTFSEMCGEYEIHSTVTKEEKCIIKFTFFSNKIT